VEFELVRENQPIAGSGKFMAVEGADGFIKVSIVMATSQTEEVIFKLSQAGQNTSRVIHSLENTVFVFVAFAHRDKREQVVPFTFIEPIYFPILVHVNPKAVVFRFPPPQSSGKQGLTLSVQHFFTIRFAIL
jgi:hypothetical protein